MTVSDDLRDRIIAVINSQCPFPVESPDSDLIDSGVLDSTTLIEVVLALEEHFGLSLPIDEIDIEDLRTTGAIAALIARAGERARHAA